MKNITLAELLEAGCHFGHQVSRWNPKAKEFIYGERDGVHVIDLVKTKKALEEAADFIKTTASQGGSIIFVGTKRQAKAIVEEQAKRAGVFYVCQRWIGGLITNWEEVKKNLDKIDSLEEKIKNAEGIYTKAEVNKFQSEVKKLLLFYAGVRGLKELPKAVVVVDIRREDNCIREANKRCVPVVGLVDTNSDPTSIPYAIPANDDATGSIKLIMSYLADAVIEGKKVLGDKKEKEAEKIEKEEKAVKDKEKTEAKKKLVNKNKKPTKNEQKQQ